MKARFSLRVLSLSAMFLTVLSVGLAVPIEVAKSAPGTTLMWSQFEDQIYTWGDAQQSAADHTGGGYTDWRMPTVDELAAATQDGTFGYVRPGATRFWTSEKRGNRGYYVLVVADANGVVIPSQSGEVGLIGKQSTFHAKYVRVVTTPPAPGITVNPVSGLITTEAGGSDTFTVVLDTAPAAAVSIVVSTSDDSEGLVSTGTQGPATNVTLTFDGTTWNQPQTVTVTGQDDTIVDGNVAYTLATAPATSTDPNYNGLNADDVSATNQDDDQPVVTVTGIAPGSMSAGTTVNVTITGSNFAAGATVTFENGSGPAPSASSVSVVTATSITCSVTVGNGGPRGTRVWDVRVTNTDSSSGVLQDGFTVTKP